MKEPFTQNSTFHGSDPFWANACVGENGNPQIQEYATGFAAAANFLIDKIIENEGVKLHVDTFIYPICFNMRHSVELSLKSAAVYLEELSKLRETTIPSFDLSGSHHLGNIWKYVKKHALSFDDRYNKIIKELDQYITDIAEIDSTGQVFRYPFDQENKKHLVSVSLISITVLKSRWSKLEKLLKNLYYINENLLTEYSWGQFTKKLSRIQLAKIALQLPPREKWSSSDFAKTKAKVRAEYNLSSNEFSKALDTIQSHRELSGLFNHAVPIQGLDINSILNFFDIWFKKHDITKITHPSEEMNSFVKYSGRDFSELQSRWNLSKELTIEITKKISPEAFSALNSLFYFDRESKFSKIFENLHKQHLNESKTFPENIDRFLDDARHLLDKTSAFHSIVNSLNFLGQKELVDLIIEKYQLHKYRNSILLQSNQEIKSISEIPAYI